MLDTLDKGEPLSDALDVELGDGASVGDGALLVTKGDGVGVDSTVSVGLIDVDAVVDDDRVSDAVPLPEADVRGEREGERVVFAERVIGGDALANDADMERVVFADALTLTEDVPLVLERGLRLPEELYVGDVESIGDCVGDTVDSGVAVVVVL